MVPESQYGYRPGRSTEDLIYVLRQLFEKAQEKNTPMYAIFIDSVDRRLLWEVLSHFGVLPKCLTALRNLHTNMKGLVAYRGELSSKFPIHIGVRHGSIEGPVLFILFLAAMIEVAFPDNSRFHSEMGVKSEVAGGDITDVRIFRRPTLIRILAYIYADDTALVSDSFEDMQEIICQFAQTAIKFGLLITLQRTISMRFNPAVQETLTVPPFYVGNYPLEAVSSFTYLGNILTPDNSMTEEFNMQIGWARGAFFKLTRRLWNQCGIWKVTKARLFMLWCHPPNCTVLEHGPERSNKSSYLYLTVIRLSFFDTAKK